MYTLFIDTHDKNVLMILYKDGKIINKENLETKNKHSEVAMPTIDKLLKDVNVDVSELGNVIVVNGPGSFTGVRIGVTIAKTYGYLINKYITPVSSLKSLAISSNQKDVVMSVISANRNNYYVGIYDSQYNELIEEQFVNASRLLELMNEYKPYIVSNDFNVLGVYKFNKVNLDVLEIVEYYKDRNSVNYHALVPNYLKLPQAMENR